MTLREKQERFYRSRYRMYGDDPRSLSYNCRRTQDLRFQILTTLFQYEQKDRFSIHEVGCGLAHLLRYLERYQWNCRYSGSDICPEFIDFCKDRYPSCSFHLHDINVEGERIEESLAGKDYYIVSGTFNPIETTPVEEWEDFIHRALTNMYHLCRKGVAVNFLTAFSDYRDDGLYYADAGRLYAWCKENLSRFVRVKEDYPLYEFTLFVYRPEFIARCYPRGYEKYFKGLP